LWQEARKLAESLENVPPGLENERQRLCKYLQLRNTFLELHLKWLQTKDPEFLAKRKKVEAAVNALLKITDD
jgi:hypothetical protein